MRRKETWTAYSEVQLEELEKINREYRLFLDKGKTERECVEEIVRQAEAAGYMRLEDAVSQGKKLSAGDKVYTVCMKKAVALFMIGSEPIEKGMRILGAHIDSPRLDLKQNPMYEDNGFAFLDTHYYGGVKKYQWVTIPLALHGVVVKMDGTCVNICIGEEETDPVVFISDLLIHLSQEQLEKKASVVIEGENLDVTIGNRPLPETEKDAVKANILKLLKEKYDMDEEDFLSAEIEVVPANRAREAGLDRSMILAYGQDDRVCAYTSLIAQLETRPQERTCCTLLVDKEEIGSVGATGMRSMFFENAVAELMTLAGQFSEIALRRALANSSMLSSDVSAAYDPLFASCFEKKNVAFLGKGLVLNKYTGSRGKSGSNDANAEFIGRIRKMFDEEDVAFQTAELGRVDLGGGGTIAYISALYGMDVIDSGVAVLNMHAPMEATSKADVYEAVRGYKAFLKHA